MNGTVIPGTSIAVDFWKIKGKQENLIHFLTHIHGDHIVGLTSSWRRPIYCSEFTAQMLEDHYGISKSLLHVLPLNQSFLVEVPSSGHSFCVTALEANHCPGAVMLYFQGQFGNILHTGDFRFSFEMSERLADICGKVDTVYLDNTFCSPLCVFPKREECLGQIIEIIKTHPEHDVVIGMRKHGKEILLAQIGVALNETIHVSPERFLVTKHLFDSNVFSATSTSEGQFRAVPFQHISRQKLYELNQTKPTLGILPTAIFTGLPCTPFSRDPHIHVVPYSDHSSFPELVQFIQLLQPKTIIPIVQTSRGPFESDISDRKDMSRLVSYSGCNSSLLNNLTPYCIEVSSQGLKLLETQLSSEMSQQNTNLDTDKGCTKFFSLKSDFSSSKEDKTISKPNLKRKRSISVKKRLKPMGVVFQVDEKEETKSLSQKLVLKKVGVTNCNGIDPEFSLEDSSFEKIIILDGCEENSNHSCPTSSNQHQQDAYLKGTDIKESELCMNQNQEMFSQKISPKIVETSRRCGNSEGSSLTLPITLSTSDPHEKNRESCSSVKQYTNAEKSSPSLCKKQSHPENREILTCKNTDFINLDQVIDLTHSDPQEVNDLKSAYSTIQTPICASERNKYLITDLEERDSSKLIDSNSVSSDSEMLLNIPSVSKSKEPVKNILSSGNSLKTIFLSKDDFKEKLRNIASRASSPQDMNASNEENIGAKEKKYNFLGRKTSKEGFLKALKNLMT